MAKLPLNEYYLVNFNDLTEAKDIPSETLQRVWKCEWSREQLAHILTTWTKLNQNEGVPFDGTTAELLLCHAIELTLIFVQHNFTGPFVQQLEFAEVISKADFTGCSPFEVLMENGEELNSNVKLGELLVLAKEILWRLLDQWDESLFLQWWRMRLLCLQQHLLDDLTSNLYEQFKATAELLLKLKEDAPLKSELEALLYIELSNGYLQFQRTQKSEELLRELCHRLQIVLNVEGLLGLRTKFQQKPLPQLCLKVTKSTENDLPSSASTNGSTPLPKLLLLDDDTRLERIRFIEPKDNEVMSLPSVLQGLVLAKVKILKRSQPKDRLADEELEPYIQTLLYQTHGALQTRQSALLLNCIQESNQRRTVERSWKQCEEVVKLLSMPTTKYTLPVRFSYSFASCIQPRWQMQMQLCDLLISLGMTKSALDIYIQLQAWGEVINCYTRLELRHKAAEIIRQELGKKPTTLLHCLLGDATDDPACYATAWEFSKQTSGKAQAHWGNYHFYRKEYAEAIPHLERSVQINPLQEKVWLRLGYAAIILERWELAVHAYITYTHLEPLGFESWNNLAKALIKLGDKKRAHKVLNESLKCNYTNWKVWENFMLVSVDTGNFEDVINAYSRLSELKERFIDLEVLCITMHAVAEGKPDAKGQTSERLLKKAIYLLGQQCVKHGNEPKLWELAALLAATPLNKAQKLVKAYRAYTVKETTWVEKQPDSLKALQLCRDLCTCSLEAIEEHAPDESGVMITSQLSSARLTTQSCIRAVERTKEKWPENEQLLVELQKLLESVSEKLKERMNSR